MFERIFRWWIDGDQVVTTERRTRVNALGEGLGECGLPNPERAVQR